MYTSNDKQCKVIPRNDVYDNVVFVFTYSVCEGLWPLPSSNLIIGNIQENQLQVQKVPVILFDLNYFYLLIIDGKFVTPMKGIKAVGSTKRIQN